MRKRKGSTTTMLITEVPPVTAESREAVLRLVRRHCPADASLIADALGLA